MRRLTIFGHGVHRCGFAAIVFALSLAAGAGIGMDSDGGGFFIYWIPVSGNVALAAWIASAAGMAGAVLFVATFATVSIVRSFREGQLQPRGFAVVVRARKPGPPAHGVDGPNAPGTRRDSRKGGRIPVWATPRQAAGGVTRV